MQNLYHYEPHIEKLPWDMIGSGRLALRSSRHKVKLQAIGGSGERDLFGVPMIVVGINHKEEFIKGFILNQQRVIWELVLG